MPSDTSAMFNKYTVIVLLFYFFVYLIKLFFFFFFFEERLFNKPHTLSCIRLCFKFNAINQAEGGSMKLDSPKI